ncbi:hypothetical protein KIN20_013824 [Parelaphostrongylus tenuis]|uniref:Uncharacterized protein n=1 Tax=Parelaphostrongylus tenuis TaxID=148309 RepID=A0AAD5MY24_PARTN|nr:hypothetical protein KIN20_013824 [Parelaphostrongylus tenuis]
MIVSYSHRRSLRRTEKAKRKARPELNHFGWDTLGLAEKFTFPECRENTMRVDSSALSFNGIRELFESPRIPCIITHPTEGWQANEKWTTSVR